MSEPTVEPTARPTASEAKPESARRVSSDEYDAIAEGVFAPVFPTIARFMVERTGVRTGRLLDVGCGGGHMGLAVMELGDYAEAVFCDISPRALELAAERIESRGLSGRARTVQGDVHRLPFDDESFDLVVSRGSMPFWDDQLLAFRELYRVLAPGGRAYVGGGLGSAENRARVQAAAKASSEAGGNGTGGTGAKGGGFRPFDPRNSKALPSSAYEELFRQLGACYRVVDDPDEGRWMLFGKGGQL